MWQMIFRRKWRGRGKRKNKPGIFPESLTRFMGEWTICAEAPRSGGPIKTTHGLLPSKESLKDIASGEGAFPCHFVKDENSLSVRGSS